MSTVRLAGAVAIAILLLARDGRAADDRRLREQDRVAVGASFDGSASPNTTALAARQIAPALDASIRVAPSWIVTAEGALASTSYRVGEQRPVTATRSSNVILGVRWSPWLPSTAHGLRWAFGLSAGAPLVTVPSGGIAVSANAEQSDRVALGAAGPRGTWLWARNAVPIVGLARASRALGALQLNLELEPGLLVSVNRDASRAALVATAEVAATWANVSPYAALSCVASTRALESRDFAQTGAAIGVRQDLGRLFAWSEGRLQLDAPAGVADR